MTGTENREERQHATLSWVLSQLTTGMQEDGKLPRDMAQRIAEALEAEQPQIFHRFYRTETAGKHAVRGSGLGLFLSKTIVESHGGHIGVISSPQQGSCFWFALPIHA